MTVRETGLTRDVRKNGIAGWRVRLSKNGKQVVNKFFNDSVLGGAEISLQRAKDHRNKTAAQFNIDVSKNFHEGLYTTRMGLQLTQSQAAKLLNISTLTYCRWEREKNCGWQKQEKVTKRNVQGLLAFLASAPTAIQTIPVSEFSTVRVSLGLSKSEMSEILCIGQETLSRWESGKSIPEAWAFTFVSAMHAGWKFRHSEQSFSIH
jgi:DNA-binding transcriptional regulator YiaG